jgi:glycogenin
MVIIYLGSELILGGDQGLLNTFFPSYHRLSFTYNVTPSTSYQYAPAYRHFSSNISLFHFIGRTKPWSQRNYTGGGSASTEATARWWSVYEKHFGWKIREEELTQHQESALRRGRDTTPRPRSSESFQPTYSSLVQPYIRPSTADRTRKQASFGSPDTTFFRASAPAPEMSSLSSSYRAPSSPQRYSSPPRQPSPSGQASPPRQQSPPRQPSLHRQPSPPRGPSLRRQQSPPRQQSQPRHQSPPRQQSQPRPPSPTRHQSQPRPPSPTRHQSQPRPPSPTRHQSQPRPPSPTRQQSRPRPLSPPRQPSPPRRPFEPTMAAWDPARSAPPSDSGPEAKGLSISAYESAWDKPFDPNEPKWVPPERTPLPEGYEYTPPSPPPEHHDTSSESEDEVAEPSGYNTSDSESADDHRQRRTERYSPVFPWETRGQRQIATRVFPGDRPPEDKGKAPRAQPFDRRVSFDNYGFTNA